MLLTACNVVKNIESNYGIFCVTDFRGACYIVRNDRLKLFNSSISACIFFFFGQLSNDRC